MPTWTFQKAGGAPSGNIHLDLADAEFDIDDSTHTSIVTSDPHLAGELSAIPFLQVSGGGPTVLPLPIGVATYDVVRDFGADPTGVNPSDLAFTKLRDAIKASRGTDPDASGSFKLCTSRGYIPPGRYLVSTPGALMDNTGDPFGTGTFGYELFGAGELSRIIYSGTGPIFNNTNQYLFPRVRDMMFVGGNSAAVTEYSASAAQAQGWTYENVVWWGTWNEGIQLDAYKTTIGTATVSIASPGVVSRTAHGLNIGDTFLMNTTGALPTGMTANQTYTVLSAGFTANSFEFSTSAGGAAINTSGTQSGTHTLVKVQANGNDSHSFMNCRVKGNWTNAFFHSGLTSGGVQQDQAISHSVVGGNYEPTQFGDIFRFDYGGHMDFSPRSVILPVGSINGNGAGAAISMPNGGTHNNGVCNFRADNVRFEVRAGSASDTPGKMIDCRWQFGGVSFDNCSNDGFPATPASQTVATFYGTGNCGPQVEWKNCQFRGVHEYKYGTSPFGGVSKATYRSCSSMDHADLTNMILHTDGSGGFATGNKWIVDMDEKCRGGAPFNSQGQGRVYRSVPSWYQVSGAEVHKTLVNFKTQFGVLPQNGGAYTLYLPFGSILTGVHQKSAGKAGGPQTTWAHVLTNGRGTATITIASPSVATSGVAHGLIAGQPVIFSTTGALPTGITAGVVYYVLATGLTTTAFQFAATVGGTAINTSGTQSGTHSISGGLYTFSPGTDWYAGYEDHAVPENGKLNWSWLTTDVLRQVTLTVTGINDNTPGDLYMLEILPGAT